MMINQSNIDSIIQYSLLVAGNEDDYFDQQLGPIHLIKYVYLADISYARRNSGASFTGIKWQFYNFGPWSPEVHERIEPALIAIHANKQEFASQYDDKSDWVRWNLRNDDLFRDIERDLPGSITIHLKPIIHKYKKDTPGLLDFVYKSKPMLSAKPNDYLDLSLAVDDFIKDESDTHNLRMEGLSNKKRKIFQKELEDIKSKRIKLKQESPKLVRVVDNPRYDDIYEKGVLWLESLSGDQFSPSEKTVEFSEEVWNSSTRKGNDFS